MNQNSPDQGAAGGAPKASRTFEELEAAIAAGLPKQDEAAHQVAVALFEIHERELYRPAYQSFKDYLARRWNLSRARAYQLLHFARLKHMSTAVDTKRPENERQARALDTNGKPRRRREDNPVLRAMNYLANLFCRLTPDQRRELVECIGELLRDMEREIDRDEPAKGQA
jgi:hypothetical protein